jgi:hypothetical protein
MAAFLAFRSYQFSLDKFNAFLLEETGCLEDFAFRAGPTLPLGK